MKHALNSSTRLFNLLFFACLVSFVICPSEGMAGEWQPGAEPSSQASNPIPQVPLFVGKGIAGIAYGFDSIWVTLPQEGNVYRIDPTTGKIVAEIFLGDEPGMIAFSQEAVWVTQHRKTGVVRIDPKINRAVKRIDLGDIPASIAANSEAVWLTLERTGSLVQVDPKTDTLVGTPVHIGRSAGGVEIGDHTLWATSPSEAAVLRIDPQTAPAGLKTIRVDQGPMRVALGEGGLWVVDSRSDSVTRIDPQSDTTVAKIHVGKEPIGLAIGGGSIWVCNHKDNTLSRIDPHTNQVTATVPVGKGPFGAVYGAGTLWVTNNEDGTVSTLAIQSPPQSFAPPHVRKYRRVLILPPVDLEIVTGTSPGQLEQLTKRLTADLKSKGIEVMPTDEVSAFLKRFLFNWYDGDIRTLRVFLNVASLAQADAVVFMGLTRYVSVKDTVGIPVILPLTQRRVSGAALELKFVDVAEGTYLINGIYQGTKKGSLNLPLLPLGVGQVGSLFDKPSALRTGALQGALEQGLKEFLSRYPIVEH